MSFSAAAIAASVIGTGSAAAPASKPAAGREPTGKHSGPSKISKFRQHQLDQLKVAAPGDEYFGRMKLSYLGINNTFHDDAIRAGDYTTNPGLISSVNFADEALHQWANRYPRDPQLPRTWFLAMRMYRKIFTQPAQQKAFEYMHLIAERFPDTFFGKLEKRDLKIGFTEHYFALPQACPSPLPIPTLPPGGHAPRSTPTPSATPQPTPSPTASPTPASNTPAVIVLPVPCFTPQPTPSPTPVPTPAPSTPPTATPPPVPSGAMTPVPSPVPTHSPR